MNQKLKESIWRYLSGIVLVVYSILSFYWISEDKEVLAHVITGIGTIILLALILSIDSYFKVKPAIKNEVDSQFTKELDESIKYEKIRLINNSAALKLIQLVREKGMDPKSQEALDHISVELCWPSDKVKKFLRGHNTMTLTFVDIVDVETLLGCEVVNRVKEI